MLFLCKKESIMKAASKWSLCLLFIIGFLFGSAVFSGAGLELGISMSITPEKDMYEAGDAVRFNTAITNNTDTNYTDLTLVYYLPAQITPDESFEQTISIKTLGAGQTFQDSRLAGIIGNDSSSSVLWIILAIVLLAAAVVGIFFFLRRKKVAAPRVLAFFLLCALSLSPISLAAEAAFIAPERTYVSAETVMRKLGVIPATLSSSDAIRKRDLAQSLFVLLNGHNDASSYANEGYFSDVPKSHPQAGYINFAGGLGIMEWEEDEEGKKTFIPTERMSIQDIARCFMRLLCGGNGRGEFTQEKIDALIQSSGLSTGFVKLNMLATPASLGTLFVNLLTITPSAAVKNGAFINVSDSSDAFASYCPAFTCENSVITTEAEATQTGVRVITAQKTGTPVYLLSKNGFSFAAPRPALLAVTAGKIQYGEDTSLPIYAALYEKSEILPYYGNKPAMSKPTDEEEKEEKPKDPPKQENPTPEPENPLTEILTAAIVVDSDDMSVTLVSCGATLSFNYPDMYGGYRPFAGEVVVVNYVEDELVSIEKPQDLVGWVTKGSGKTVKVDMDSRSFPLFDLVADTQNENELKPASSLPEAIENNNGRVFAALFIYNEKVIAWLPAELDEPNLLITTVSRHEETGELSYLYDGLPYILTDIPFPGEESEKTVPTILSIQNNTVVLAERLLSITAQATLEDDGSITAGELVFLPQNILTGLAVENSAAMNGAEDLLTRLAEAPAQVTLYYQTDGRENTLFAFSL